MIAGIELYSFLGSIVSFFLTILVLLYAFGDNALFRLAIHIFVGVAAGYAGAVALREVLVPQLFSLEIIPMIVTGLLMFLLILKLVPQAAILGNPASALLVGVGAAIAIGGAIQGTLLPQITSAGDYFSPVLMQQAIQAGNMGTAFGLFFNGSVILVGTVSTLIFFHFSARNAPNQIPQRNRVINWIGYIGQIFIAITFGVIFAGVYTSALTALIDRMNFLVDVLLTIYITFTSG